MEDMRIPVRRFQIHLSTLLLLVVFAGILLGLHVLPREQTIKGLDQQYTIIKRGYPLLISYYESHHSLSGGGGGMGENINPFAALLNFILVLVPVGAINELRLRHKTGNDEPRFAIHGVPALIVAVLLFWLVKANWSPGNVISSSGGGGEYDWTTSILIERGWPQSGSHVFGATLASGVLTFFHGDTMLQSVPYTENRFNSGEIDALVLKVSRVHASFSEIAQNIVACGLILAGSLCISEYWWRRRLRRKAGVAA